MNTGGYDKTKVSRIRPDKFYMENADSTFVDVLAGIGAATIIVLSIIGLSVVMKGF